MKTQKIGHSKVSGALRSVKRSVFLFVLFLFFSPVSVFAYDWSEVISAYSSVPINYPDSSAWIEKTPLGGYNVWKRPTDSVWKSRMDYSYDSAQVFLQAQPVITYNGDYTWTYVYSYLVYQTLNTSISEVSCLAVDGLPQAGAQSSRQFSISCTCLYTGDMDALDACVVACKDLKKQEVPPPVDGSVFDCKAYDVLVNTFPDTVNNCENRTLSMSVGGMIDADPLISNSCQCTPAGTKYFETSESGMCRYRNIVGDPTDPDTNIIITAPGFTVLTASDPVTTRTTNPDGTITTTDTVTNTYPDSTQSQDSTSITTYPDNSTSTDITTGANIIGGVAIGGTNTNTITSGDNTLSTTTYPSSLITTVSTVGATTTTTLTKKDADGGGGGDIWESPPPTVTIPSIPSASSHTSEYSTDRPSIITDEQVAEKDIKTLIGDFIATSPLVSAVQNTRIETINSECSFTSGDVFGSPVTLDFCSLDYLFSIFGVLFVIICTFRSFFILFGID